MGVLCARALSLSLNILFFCIVCPLRFFPASHSKERATARQVRGGRRFSYTSEYIGGKVRQLATKICLDRRAGLV